MKRLSISTKRRKSFQMSLLLIIGIWVVTSTSKFVYLNFFSSWSDAAGYVSLLDQIRAGHGMLSPMYNAGTWFFEINSHTSVHTWCEFPSVNRYANFSRWHPYLILFPLGTLANILHISSLSLLSILTSISYLAPIFHIFYFLYFKHQKSLYRINIESILKKATPTNVEVTPSILYHIYVFNFVGHSCSRQYLLWEYKPAVLYRQCLS